jgi:uncharacterized protein YukE
MDDSFEVAIAALREHATEMTGLADQLRNAFDVAGHVTLTRDAYGQPCEQVVTMLNAVADKAGQVVRAGIRALDVAATGLRDSAGTYTRTDTASANAFSGVTGQLS